MQVAKERRRNRSLPRRRVSQKPRPRLSRSCTSALPRRFESRGAVSPAAPSVRQCSALFAVERGIGGDSHKRTVRLADVSRRESVSRVGRSYTGRPKRVAVARDRSAVRMEPRPDARSDDERGVTTRERIRAVSRWSGPACLAGRTARARSASGAGATRPAMRSSHGRLRFLRGVRALGRTAGGGREPVGGRDALCRTPSPTGGRASTGQRRRVLVVGPSRKLRNDFSASGEQVPGRLVTDRVLEDD